MKPYIKEEDKHYVVYAQRDSGMIPIFSSKHKDQAELMLKYITEV